MVDWNTMPDSGRRDTFVKTLRSLEALCPGPLRIVETGTIRDERPQPRQGNGWSTLAWAWLAAAHGGQIYTLDSDPVAIAVCQRVTQDYASRITYVCADPVAFLTRWSVADNGPIHLLYLHSLDDLDAEASARHHAAEIEVGIYGLAQVCLVLMDDTRAETALRQADTPQFCGKGAAVVPFLLARQFRIELCDGGQVLLSRGQPPEGAMTERQKESPSCQPSPVKPPNP